jgi:predicted metal-dependent phosphoesterase TrpH
MRFIRSILVLASLVIALPLAAQSQPDKTSPKIQLGDSLDLKVSPELEKSLDELGKAVQALALRIANDPHLRAAAVQVATGFVTTAQQVVAEQGDAIEHALKTAAERIATAETERKRQQNTRP